MINNVILMGRLTVDPVLKTTPSGIFVLQFGLAVDRDYSKEKQECDFINIVAWKTTAEFISKYFTKGSMIAIVGRLQTRTYTDKNGEKRYICEVVADKVSFTGEKRNATQGNSDVLRGISDNEEIISDDDVPF